MLLLLWKEEQAEAFRQLKIELKSENVMADWSPTARTCLTVDASPHAVGAILQQEQTDGTFKVAEYASWSLSDVEKCCCQREKVCQ